MIKGPLGLPRPLVKMKVLISKRTSDVDVVGVGPFGKKRPLVSASRGAPSEKRVDKCMQSDGAHKFAEGLEKNPFVTPDQIESATRAWCKGILTSTKRPTRDPAESLPQEHTPPEGDVIDVEGEVIDTDGQTEEIEGLPDVPRDLPGEVDNG
jgi:hypothetical protein